MIIYLLSDVFEPSVLSDALKGLAEEGVERLVACASLARPVNGDGEGSNPHHPANEQMYGMYPRDRLQGNRI